MTGARWLPTVTNDLKEPAMASLQELQVDAGPAVSEDLADIYADNAEDLSSDLDLIILDHPSIDDVIRISELGKD
ncbi:MAG TPA: hypothetical protein VGA36_01300 [Nitriliruptorales bacterium]